ncbi:NADH dehydrogenase subunit E [Roseovarius mucosus]|uniref:NADH dehydrogenase subunit E n=1 Tax=Roseovarius mucosus TaxID=215743 RepID=A0A1V0RJA6_9RHOB|nr:DUF5333 domain-containing protein [Roseovarius mucosus]ARE81735.1 NADH dehydrogenase subunit E [Roseovarius mucosus]
MRMILSFVLSLGLGVSSGVAAVRAGSLAQEADINQGLFYMAVADEIRKRCADISPRVMTAISYMRALKAEAQSRGYTEAEIDAYISDKAEKRKIRGRSDDYIRSMGAMPNDGPSLCDLGRAEIAKQSPIGKFLKAK